MFMFLLIVHSMTRSAAAPAQQSPAGSRLGRLAQPHTAGAFWRGALRHVSTRTHARTAHVHTYPIEVDRCSGSTEFGRREIGAFALSHCIHSAHTVSYLVQVRREYTCTCMRVSARKRMRATPARAHARSHIPT
jgi:hypothetical protein